MNDLMIDIETGSLQHDATIYSIAAVVFDRISGNIGPSMHIALCVDQGRHFDNETSKWWTHTDRFNALLELIALRNNSYRIDLGLEKLAKLIEKHKTQCVWSNGASFDIAILTNAYRQFDIPIPWKFWHERDTRTIIDACRMITGVDPKKITTMDSTPHNALNDAIYQAKYVANAFNVLVKQGGQL